MFITKKMLYLTFLLSLMFNAFFVGTSFAAGEAGVKFQQLDVSLWAEFDRSEKWTSGEPAVLLMYNGTLTNTSDQPYNGRISFNVPDGYILVNMMCETEKGMVCQPYKVDKTDKGSYLSWQPTRPIKPGDKFPFMVEMYYNPIKGDPDKKIDFSFDTTLDVDTLNLDIKAPLKASNFLITPASSQSTRDNEGFTSYFYSFNNVKKGESKSYKISYSKGGSDPSILPVAQSNNPAQPQNPGTSGTENASANNFPAIFGVVIISIITFASLYYFGVLRPKNRERVYNYDRKGSSVKKHRRSDAIEESGTDLDKD